MSLQEDLISLSVSCSLSLSLFLLTLALRDTGCCCVVSSLTESLIHQKLMSPGNSKHARVCRAPPCCAFIQRSLVPGTRRTCSLLGVRSHKPLLWEVESTWLPPGEGREQGPAEPTDLLSPASSQKEQISFPCGLIP